MKTIKEMKLKQKKVLLRLDLNVPLKNGKIQDDYRIKQSIKTIQKILSQQPKQLIIMSHLGRPKGRDEELSMKPIAKKLAQLIERPIYLHEDLTKPIENPNPIVLLENLRFYEGEKKGSKRFARQLASFGEIYINDAFGVSHRKDASVYELAKLLPGTIGPLIRKELKNVHLNHKKPITVIFGAAKIKDKIKLLKTLLDKVDKVLLGGAVVFTFYKAMNLEVGKSLVEDEMLIEAKKILKKYSSKIILPVDIIITKPSNIKKFNKLTVSERKKLLKIVDFDIIPKNQAGYDIGPKSIKLFKAIINNSKTIIWNGPLGLFEIKPFDKSTNEITKYLAMNKKTTIVCGGDTASAIRKTAYAEEITHISTGGGASLELLGGKKLPAIKVLENN